jgi:hypothetical protein
VTKNRKGPSQIRLRANHADVIAYRTKKDEIGLEEELIKAKREARAKRLAIEELKSEGVVFKHN